MHQWIWQHVDWPKFFWDDSKTNPFLTQARFIQGKLLGMVQAFNSDIQTEISTQALADEMITTSAIEGELLDRDSVRSSIAHRLGLVNAGISAKFDRYIEGLLNVLLDATNNYNVPLTQTRLKAWHAALFPTGYSGIKKISVGEFRGEGAMEIISGRPGKITVHYVAPPKKGLDKKIKKFLQWINADSEMDGIIKSSIAHLWFEILHPFDDGNGRIGRAIIEMLLAKDEKLSVRYYSLSNQILSQRKSYYQILEKITKGDLDITAWIKWFLKCYINAIEKTIHTVNTITRKARYWQKHVETELNQRQRKVLNRMLEVRPDEFIGGITTKKYMHLTRASRATAYRELTDLVNKECLKPLGGKGRSSAYTIDFPS